MICPNVRLFPRAVREGGLCAGSGLGVGGISEAWGKINQRLVKKHFATLISGGKQFSFSFMRQKVGSERV